MDKGRKEKRKRISKELEKKEERLVTSGKTKMINERHGQSKEERNEKKNWKTKKENRNRS